MPNQLSLCIYFARDAISMYVHSWGALLGLSSLIVPLPPHPHPTRAACTPLSHLYSPRMPPMPHTSLTAQVSTHTPCAPHASRPLLSRLAHRQKKTHSYLASRTAQKNLACSGAGSPHSKLAAAKRACSSVSSDCEALRSSCSLPALLNMRSTPADEAGRPRCCLAILASVGSPSGRPDARSSGGL